jgi:hypothetical protein
MENLACMYNCRDIYLCKKRIVLPRTYERLQYSENANYLSVFCEDGMTQLKKNLQDCECVFVNPKSLTLIVNV